MDERLQNVVMLYLIEFGDTQVAINEWYVSNAFIYYIGALKGSQRRNLNAVVRLTTVNNKSDTYVELKPEAVKQWQQLVKENQNEHKK